MLERLLIVGLGSIGSRHVRVVRKLVPEVRIMAFRHRSQPGEPPAGVDRTVNNLDEALGWAPQAAVIANPSSCHLDVAIPLARSGVHLLVEKPISNSPDRVAELLAVSAAKHTVLMTGYNLRFSPSLQRFRQLIEEQRVGRVLTIRAEVGQYLPTWRPGTDYRETVSAQAALGGGVLLELSHEIDYLRWLFGEVESVTASLQKLSSLEMDAEDAAQLTMSFTARGNDSPAIAYLTMDCIRQDPTRACTVVGETGTLRWNALSGTVELFSKGADAWQTVFEYRPHTDETYEEEWRHFLSCLSSGSQPIVSGHDGLAVLQIVEAARRSSMTRANVLIGSDWRAASVTA